MSNPFDEIEKIFHEPNRLSIVSELSARIDGMAFGELKQACDLTDGNLSRHLAALEKAGTVSIEKSFVGARPRTTVSLTDSGRAAFLNYLSALEEVLKHAARRAKGAEKKVAGAGVGKRLKPA